MNINEIAAMTSLGTLHLEQKSETSAQAAGNVSTFGTEIREEKEISFKKNPFNLYGADIENFQKFKGKDKYDALNATNKASSNVNNLYKDFKKAYPDIDVEFDTPPNPADFGKKREGFQSYMQELERWENNCKKAIEEAMKKQKSNNAAIEQPKANEQDPATPAPEEPDEAQEPKSPAKPKPKSKTVPKQHGIIAHPKQPTFPPPDDEELDEIRKMLDSLDTKKPRRLLDSEITIPDDKKPPSNLIPIQNSPGMYVDKNTGKFVKWGKQPIEYK